MLSTSSHPNKYCFYLHGYMKNIDEPLPIDTRLLRYFIAVADELSFSRAARRLHLSQPPLSYAIKQLEENLGVQLLRRSSRKVELTAAGAALHREARFLLQRNNELRELVAHVDAGLKGRLKMGFVGSMMYRGLPAIMALCRDRYPDLDIAITEMNSAELMDMVLHGGLDIGFVHANPLASELASARLVSEPFVLCAPADHPIAQTRQPELASLANEKFVFFARNASPSYYQLLLAICQEAGLIPKIAYEVRHWLSVVSLVSQGMGVAIVPACMATCGLPDTAFLPFPHTPRSETLCIWRRNDTSQILQNIRAL
ncbi:MAG: LysR family transcriptional regulator, partial [Alcaligenaceae bacterium]|nr:LysR family transcriptional regulator [Alcaligenaceae bacterium]